MPTKTLHIGGTTEFQKVGLRSFGSQMTSSPAFCTHYITSSPTTYMCNNIKSKTLSAKKQIAASIVQTQARCMRLNRKENIPRQRTLTIMP